MEFSSQLLFFFSALGAFNGLILGLYYLLFAKPKDLTFKFLGMLILMLSLRVGKSVFFYFNPDLALGYLQFGLTACFFIGPFLYFYVKKLAQPNSNIDKEWKWHLVVLIPMAVIVGYMYPFETFPELWRSCIIRYIYNVWIAYTLLSLFTIRSIFKNLRNINPLDVWLLSLIIGNLILVSIYYNMSFTYYISGALSFSFLLYLSWAFIYFNKENRILYLSESKKYGDKKIEKDEVSRFQERLREVVAEQMIYKESNLKLPMVAERIKTSPHRLSQYLNDNLNKSFAQYINEYRVEAAKRLILENDTLTLEGIGYEVGFNSRSTFYTAFKKYTGKTPAAFKKSQ